MVETCWEFIGNWDAGMTSGLISIINDHEILSLHDDSISIYNVHSGLWRVLLKLNNNINININSINYDPGNNKVYIGLNKDVLTYNINNKSIKWHNKRQKCINGETLSCNNKLYYINNNIPYTFNTKTSKWNRIQSNPLNICDPLSNSNDKYDLIYLSNINKLLVFGQYIFMYSYDINKWCLINKYSINLNKNNYGSIINNKEILIFGGKINKSNKLSRDILIYNINNQKINKKLLQLPNPSTYIAFKLSKNKNIKLIVNGFLRKHCGYDYLPDLILDLLYKIYDITDYIHLIDTITHQHWAIKSNILI